MKKENMLNALRAFINQRSGIDFRNYANGNWQESRKLFMEDYRPILRHGRHARTLLRAVELRESITAEMIVEASKQAYSGRLQWLDKQHHNAKTGEYSGAWEYTAGQYFPTEYRNAACAVLASVLWHYWQPECKTGDEIRRKARQEFGRAIASTWFN